MSRVCVGAFAEPSHVADLSCQQGPALCAPPPTHTSPPSPSPSPHCLPSARGARPGRTLYTSSHQTSTSRRILKADKKGDKEDKDGNPYGIGAPAETGRIFKEITGQFCKSLTTCPTGESLAGDVFLTTNLDCTGMGQSFTLNGARLVGNGFTIKLGPNSINLQNGAKLEDVDVEGTEVPVKFESGGGAVENVSIMGGPRTCLLLQGSDIDIKTVTIEQVTCRDFMEYGVNVDITGTGALKELFVSHVTFKSDKPEVYAISIVQAPVSSRFVFESVLATGGTGGLGVKGGAELGEIHVDNLTVEDSQLVGIFAVRFGGVFPEVGMLHVTNSRVMRGAAAGISWNSIGNIILEDVFSKDNLLQGMIITNVNTVVLMNSKVLANRADGIVFKDIKSAVIDDVLSANNNADGIDIISDRLTTAVLKNIVVTDNGDKQLNLRTTTSVSPKVTIENIFACNNPKVSIDVTDGVLDIRKEFVASRVDDSCLVQDENNGFADCSASTSLIKKFESCEEFCSKKK